MDSLIYHLTRKPTFISTSTALFFIFLIVLSVYKLVIPPKVGSADNMIIEMLAIFSIVPLGLLLIDRLLVRLINNIKLTILEVIIFGSIFLYYFLVADPF
ncbi:hypothetical protein NG800_009530 [Epilithonimonas ginsengisoli]|uniref:Uncharacterized protein n=1 Tax=Epilithonimonas ginsengisoli TaxID=1245592 RepID=A0ABU4JHQ0_9FLAO|nr:MULTISPECIES: hypothetical protein [Chryseobacterium group]MBV6880513.1 hypothetical protein [Epilithonimonas sp. FP105]MDW8549152.1 hypothetical protein [Epilithonimonas ginsengisoli]OAH72889.1 hypothetical protein AXA65_09405 [Chryseobacterium sp. FP211-J200]